MLNYPPIIFSSAIMSTYSLNIYDLPDLLYKSQHISIDLGRNYIKNN